MKPSYKENLAHVRQIWDVYKRPFLDLNAFLRHIKEYKVFNENLSSHANVPLWNAFIDPMNTCTPFVKSWRKVLANAECQINKGMQIGTFATLEAHNFFLQTSNWGEI